MSPILIFHITTASITLLTCSYAWYKQSQSIKNILHFLSITSVASGVFIAINSTGLTPLFCTKIGIYLLMIISTQLMISTKLKIKNSTIRLSSISEI